jgi:hypothetical protein
MKGGMKTLVVFLMLLSSYASLGQRINVGLTFQYLILKQVKINTNIVQGSHSYNQYQVFDNRWKFFSAGQSIIIGTVVQMDYKKFYAVIEPSFDLNTYNYTLKYPVSPNKDESLNFQTLFLQIDVPVYIGYQFGATNLIRYSVFGGLVFAFPYKREFSFQSRELENAHEEYFDSSDMDNILSNTKKNTNALLGFCIHFASLGKVDVRYHQRLGSPGDIYSVDFHSVGFGVTYYLPLNTRKKKIYYED